MAMTLRAYDVLFINNVTIHGLVGGRNTFMAVLS
jgi:hypothetical protein